MTSRPGAASGVFSLDRLLVGGGSGAENYLFAAGDVVYPDGGVDAGSFYKFVVADPTGNVRNAFPCTPASNFAATDNTYAVKANDPVSTGTSWKFTLQQFANATCTGTPAKSTFKSFYVARATSYGDSALTTPKSAFGANATAFVTVSGVKPSTTGWNATWLLPSGATACANTAGGDRPDATGSGTLPRGGGGYLQYRPVSTSTGPGWNREGNYELRPCPSFAASNEGTWKVRLALDATDFVVVSAFTVDATPPPAPAIGSGPVGPSASSSASFAFSDNEVGVTFLCQLDGGGFSACASPKSYTGLNNGSHTFQVKARDVAGNESEATSRTWLVDTTPPSVTLTSPAAGLVTSDATPTFAGSAGTAPGDTSTVVVDVFAGPSASGASVTTSSTAVAADGTFAVEASPSLADGTYTARARQADAAGNTGFSEPRTFTVDTTPPETTITSGPADATNDTTATFAFSSTEASATFSCSRDGGSFAGCSSPATLSGFGDGSHSFSVRATDTAGNQDPTPASSTWTVDTLSPVITLTAPADGSSTNDVTPTFSGSAGTKPGDAAAVTVDVYSGSAVAGTPVERIVAQRQSDGSYSAEASPALAEGTYTAAAQQADAAGNVGTSSPSTFSVVAPATPANTVPPSIAGPAQQGQTLTADPGSWTGTPPISYAYQWRRCDTAGANCTDIAAATAQTYTIVAADVGRTLRVAVTATNSAGSSSATSAETAVVAGTVVAPSNTSPPTISGSATDGQTLTADAGTWSGTPPLSYGYQWRRCDSAGASCTDIAAATAQTYTIVAADAGSTLRVGVTASNSAGSSTASSAPTAVVAAQDAVIAAGGDIACDPASSLFNGGVGTATACHQKYTSDLFVGTNVAGVLPLGDDQYECGGLSAFQQSYGPTWGRAKSITHPVPGNREYVATNAGGTDCDGLGKATGYFGYFGATAGDPSKGYYSYDIGNWHLIALNSNCANVGGCGAGSPQETWLKNDLAAHPANCTLAYWHHPRFSSGSNGNNSTYQPFWQDLYNGNAELVLVGHDHDYERFAPQNAASPPAADPTRGIREFVVGTGGENFGNFFTIRANSEVRQNTAFGILKLTLHVNGYDWQFVPEAGKTFGDSGSTTCH